MFLLLTSIFVKERLSGSAVPLWSQRPFAHNFSHFRYTRLLDPERTCLWQTVVSGWRHPCCSRKSSLRWTCIFSFWIADCGS